MVRVVYIITFNNSEDKNQGDKFNTSNAESVIKRCFEINFLTQINFLTLRALEHNCKRSTSAEHLSVSASAQIIFTVLSGRNNNTSKFQLCYNSYNYFWKNKITQTEKFWQKEKENACIY